MERKVDRQAFGDGRQLPVTVAASAAPAFAPDTVPTPSRFLAECGLLSITPLVTGYSEVNPFETSFAYPPATSLSHSTRPASVTARRNPSEAAKSLPNQEVRQRSPRKDENYCRRTTYVDPDDQFAALRLLAEESVLTPPLPVFTKSKWLPATTTATSIGVPGAAVPLFTATSDPLPPRPPPEYACGVAAPHPGRLSVRAGDHATPWAAVCCRGPPVNSVAKLYVPAYTAPERYPPIPTCAATAGHSDASGTYPTYTQQAAVHRERPEPLAPVFVRDDGRLPARETVLKEAANLALSSFRVSATECPAALGLSPVPPPPAPVRSNESSPAEDTAFKSSNSPPPSSSAVSPTGSTRKRRIPLRPGEGVWNPRNDPVVGQSASSAVSSSRKTGDVNGESGSSQKRNKVDSLSSASDREEETHEEKRRRFLERNRMAASKCRQKKKEWVQQLERRAAEVTATNKNLHALVAHLKEEVLRLKALILAHRDCNCNVIQQYVQTSGLFNAGGVPLGHQQNPEVTATRRNR